MNDDIAQLLAQEDLRCCRRCRQFFGPMYGSLKRESADSLFSPRSIRVMVDRIAGEDAGTYFECYECESKRRRKRVVFYSVLAAIVAIALLFREVSSGRLGMPW